MGGGTPDGGAADATEGGSSTTCFSGTPTTNENFLNACPDPTVEVYDKPGVMLPGGLKVGDMLPALQ
jgi:hypothetical protein